MKDDTVAYILGLFVGAVLGTTLGAVLFGTGHVDEEQIRCEAVHEVCGETVDGEWLPVKDL